MSLKITAVRGYEILDSRGNPTLKARVTLSDGSTGYGYVPSGASTGEGEALELRDHDAKCYLGKGVSKACRNLEQDIAAIIIGRNPYDQDAIDADLIESDGTVNKVAIGANAMLAASLAIADAAANAAQLPMYAYLGGDRITLPVPFMNIINGGAHANNTLDVQEFMIVPHAFPTFSEAMRAGVETYHHLRTALAEAGHSTAVGDEGGFAPNFKKTTQALDFIVQAIEKAGYTPGEQIGIALDVAASELFADGQYHLKGEKKALDANEMVAWYQKLIKKYPLLSIEDGLAQDDWAGWAAMNTALGEKMQLVGDDIFVTSMAKLNKGLKEKSANAILIKPNQIGTLTETLSCVCLAKKNQWGTMISHRSGETESSFIADLAVGTSAGQIKAGAPCRSDRLAKYNRLLCIEKDLQNKAPYLGSQLFSKKTEKKSEKLTDKSAK